jgi:hypothetical protein
MLSLRNPRLKIFFKLFFPRLTNNVSFLYVAKRVDECRVIVIYSAAINLISLHIFRNSQDLSLHFSFSIILSLLISVSIKESEDLSSSMSFNGLFVIHNAIRSSQHQITKLSRRQEIVFPFFNVFQWHVKSGRNTCAFV